MKAENALNPTFCLLPSASAFILHPSSFCQAFSSHPAVPLHRRFQAGRVDGCHRHLRAGRRSRVPAAGRRRGALRAQLSRINKSDNSLRLQPAKAQAGHRHVHRAALARELPRDRHDGRAQVAPQSTATVSAQGILLWVSLGPAYDMQPTSGTNTARYPSPAHDHPQPPRQPGGFSRRPVPELALAPARRPPGHHVARTLHHRDARERQHGRRHALANRAGASRRSTASPAARISDTGATSFTVNLDLSNTRPAHYDHRTAKRVHRARGRLRRLTRSTTPGATPSSGSWSTIASTNNMSNAGQVLIRDVDPSPLELDPNTGRSHPAVQLSTAAGATSRPCPSTCPCARSTTPTPSPPGRLHGLQRVQRLPAQFSPQMGVKVRLD